MEENGERIVDKKKMEEEINKGKDVDEKDERKRKEEFITHCKE